MSNLFFIVAIIFAPVFATPQQDASLAKADQLFADRDNLDSLKHAAQITEQVAAREQSNFEAQWRLAKFRYYLADRESDKRKKSKLLEAGIEAAKRAIALNPKRAEGHFWFAANAGEYTDLQGGISALGYVKTIRKEFEAALAVDPSYENGAIYLALGEIDLNLPGLFGGNDKRGLERLEAGLKIAPNNAELKIAIAQVYSKKDKREEAKKLLKSVLESNDTARSRLEQEELRTKVRRLLDSMK
ncbi:MAG TPA: TRAP transporter TatT component family protein [Blastocatellia bacterium]|nr:TRAP transporter TatT component family protein [Blastocatellia bacterium]